MSSSRRSPRPRRRRRRSTPARTSPPLRPLARRRQRALRQERGYCETWDNGYTHAWTQVRARPSGHVGSCIARRPAFSH
eukprot:3198808-Prymnesium_polylepis.1